MDDFLYWPGYAMPYANIAVAESALCLAHTFDVTLCKHCSSLPKSLCKRARTKRTGNTSTRPIYHCSRHQNVRCRLLHWPFYSVIRTAQLQVRVNTIVRLSNSLMSWQERRACTTSGILCHYYQCLLTQEARSLVSASREPFHCKGVVRCKLVNASFCLWFRMATVNIYAKICAYYTYNNNSKIRTNIRHLKIHSNIWLTFEYTEYSDIRPRLGIDTVFAVESSDSSLTVHWPHTFMQWLLDGNFYILLVHFHFPPPPTWVWDHKIEASGQTHLFLLQSLNSIEHYTCT